MAFEVSITNASELSQWFDAVGRRNDTPSGSRTLDKGQMVSADVRKEMLISIEQGRIVVNGKSVLVKFEDLGGGVWRAYVDYFQEQFKKDIRNGPPSN